MCSLHAMFPTSFVRTDTVLYNACIYLSLKLQ